MIIGGRSNAPLLNEQALFRERFQPSGISSFRIGFSESVGGIARDLYKIYEFSSADGDVFTNEEEYINSGFARPGVKFVEGMTSGQAQLLAERFDHNYFNQTILGASQKYGFNAPFFMGSFTGGVFDPFNIIGLSALKTFTTAARAGERAASFARRLGVGGTVLEDGARAIGRTYGAAKAGAVVGTAFGTAAEVTSQYHQALYGRAPDVGIAMFNIGLATAAGGAIGGGASVVSRSFGKSKPFKLYDTIRRTAPDYGDKLNHAAMAKAVFDISSGKKVDVSSVFPDVPDNLRLKQFVVEAATIGNHTIKPDTLSVFRQLAEVFPEVSFLNKVKGLQEGSPILNKQLIRWIAEDADKNFTADTARVLDILGAKTEDVLFFKLVGKSLRDKLTLRQANFIKKFGDPEITPEKAQRAYDGALIDSLDEFGNDLAMHNMFSRELETQHSVYRHQVLQDEPEIPNFTDQRSRVKDEKTKNDSEPDNAQEINQETENIFEQMRSRMSDASGEELLQAVKSVVNDMKSKVDLDIKSIEKAMKVLRKSMNCMRGNL
jgi:2-oxo-4-hydroxy-4-carboxy--5-ureidoimidazoline (OHCU) decarboxylase